MREHTSAYVGSIVCTISLIPRWQYSFNTCISWPRRRRKGKIVERPVSFLDFGRTIHSDTTNTHMHQIAMQREDLAQVPTCTIVYLSTHMASSCPTAYLPLGAANERNGIRDTRHCTLCSYISMHSESVARKCKCLCAEQGN